MDTHTSTWTHTHTLKHTKTQTHGHTHTQKHTHTYFRLSILALTSEDIVKVSPFLDEPRVNPYICPLYVDTRSSGVLVELTLPPCTLVILSPNVYKMDAA